MVRCKFKVNKISRTMGSRRTGNKTAAGHDEYAPCVMHTIEASPVYGNGDPNHENTKFWDASPGGKFELNCVNEAAVAELELGEEYYLDIRKAPAEAAR
jgi:hypothetical protein